IDEHLSVLKLTEVCGSGGGANSALASGITFCATFPQPAAPFILLAHAPAPGDPRREHALVSHLLHVQQVALLKRCYTEVAEVERPESECR
ncbi:hypothetical protein BaRGS_00025429, partial [Batillaria attramentaria]